MQATWQRLPLLFICLYRFFSLSSFFLFIYLFFPSNGTRHCATCQIVAAGRERGEKNKYRLHVCVGVCVCVCVQVLWESIRQCVCVCVCVCVNEGECCGLSQPGICALLSNELTVLKKKKKRKEKKGAISGPWHRRPPCKSKHKPESLIELSCRVASPRPQRFCFFLKSDPAWLKWGQTRHHNQLSPPRVCLLVR